MTYKPLFPVRSQVANIPVPFAVIQVKAEGCGALEKNMRKGVADRLSGQGIGWDRGISEAGFDESVVFPSSNHLRGEQESTADDDVYTRRLTQFLSSDDPRQSVATWKLLFIRRPSRVIILRIAIGYLKVDKLQYGVNVSGCST